MVFLPLKMFFVLIVVAIGLLLAMWRDRIDKHYRELVPTIERGVIIGAFAMLFWPTMDYGYQQTANVLFGRLSGPQLRCSLVIAPWALLLLFYFLRRLGKQGEMIGQIAGVVDGRRCRVALRGPQRLGGAPARHRQPCGSMAALVALAVIGFVALSGPSGAPGASSGRPRLELSGGGSDRSDASAAWTADGGACDSRFEVGQYALQELPGSRRCSQSMTPRKASLIKRDGAAS